MDGPDQIGPDTGPKRTISDRFGRFVRSFTTKYVYPNDELTKKILTMV